MTEEELNALIAHAHRRVDQLQRQLAEQIACESQHIEKSLEQQRSEDDIICRQRVAAEEERLRQAFMLEKEKWV